MKENRKLAAIMFTDIVGYSALMSKDEKLAMSILEKNRHIHKSAIAKFDGEYIKEIGDGTLAIFHSSLDAVSCAIKIMKSCCRKPAFSIRIGIHIGDIVFRDGDIFGDGVNIASRIEAGGKPGMIYISERVYEDIKNKQEIKSGFVEEKMLKNIEFPVKIYSIDAGASSWVKQPLRLTGSIKSAGIKHKQTRNIFLVIAGSALIIITAILIFFFNKPNDDKSPQRIVVAIFENRTGDPGLDDLGKMVCDWITQGLSRNEEIEVVPSTTVIQISGMLTDPISGKRQNSYLKQLAEETLAQIIVSGSYYIQNKSLQFQAEVKSATDGKLIYSMPLVSESMDQSMELIEKVSNEIVGGLAYHFQLQEIQFVSKPPSREAYSEFMTGLEYFGEDNEKAIYHLLKSVEFDSLFIQPMYFLASSFAGLGEYIKADSILGIIDRSRTRLTPFERYMLDFNIAYIKGNYVECLHFLKLAENISPGDRQVNYAIGLVALRLNKPGTTVETFAKIDYPYVKYSNYLMGAWRLSLLCNAFHLLGDYNNELAESRRGQQYFPDKIWFYISEARALAALGKTDEIEKVIAKFRSISSKSGTEGDVIMATALELRAHGHHHEAENYTSMAVEWFRNHSTALNSIEDLATALYLAGNYKEAQPIFEQLASEYPDHPEYTGYLGVLAARRGDRDEAIKISEKLKQIDRPFLFGQQTYWRSRIAALLGEPEKAVNLLNESFAQGNRFGTYIHTTIDFESMHDFEPFMELMRPKE
jgi:class 3 adenylate cyclase/tetratricopeptide (TPR) repeat protein/TolB-like protein